MDGLAGDSLNGKNMYDLGLASSGLASPEENRHEIPPVGENNLDFSDLNNSMYIAII
jgi:hypothetical protein